MRFLHGKNRKAFEYMAGKDEYIREAETYDTLVQMSADEKKQMEYEAWEKRCGITSPRCRARRTPVLKKENSPGSRKGNGLVTRMARKRRSVYFN